MEQSAVVLSLSIDIHFGRTESREICQKTFLDYSNKVLCFINATVCILIDWKP